MLLKKAFCIKKCFLKTEVCEVFNWLSKCVGHNFGPYSKSVTVSFIERRIQNDSASHKYVNSTTRDLCNWDSGVHRGEERGVHP